ncbi:MAG: GNAT family N-acetyltransferase [Sulfurimonadaceae bacterium]
MKLYWLKFGDVARLVEIAQELSCLADGYHMKLLLMHSPHLCYGAYDNGKLVGAILGVEYEKSAMIKYFIVKKEYQKQGIGKELLEIFLGMIDSKSSLSIHTKKEFVPFFERYGFVHAMEIGRFVNVGKVPPFHFTNAHAKELESHNFETVVKKLDFETFAEDRSEFLLDEMDRNSSLKFALKEGFQHSSVINAKEVYLGPWQAHDTEDAHKMMRGVLYFRGLKKVLADIPLEMPHVVALYKEYNFEEKARFVHMHKGRCSVKFENIYAFSL